MRIPQHCVACLYDKQQQLVQDEDYLAEVRHILSQRGEEDSAPYMVYLFNRAYEKRFGKPASLRNLNRRYNDLVLSMEQRLTEQIEASEDPLATALLFSRIGNYIDFSALSSVDDQVFLSLFGKAAFSEQDKAAYRSFLEQCEKARSFLLLADNCGEIVLDRLFLEQLKKRFPQLTLHVMVKGAEIQNDATMEDALQAGIDRVAEIITNGMPMAGTVYHLLPEESRSIVDRADVILSKGQANFETMNGLGWHVFYAFLCKCGLFTQRFQVPMLTGMLIEEK